MAETFYGTWQVHVPHVDTHHAECLVIAGSDNADDSYIPPYPDGTTITVTGDQWTMGIRRLEFRQGGSTWVDVPVTRATAFSASKGISVTVERAQSPKVRAYCTSMNPLLNPGPMPDPYDFSLPRDF
jgi:hypothetical protein